jgi:hypothetical protein
VIAKAELLKGRDSQYPDEYTQEISDNLDQLLIPLNKIRDAWGSPMTVNSGWRPAAINAATPGAAPQSKHMEGLAADISDPGGVLWTWVLENLQLLKDLNLFCEDRRWTPTWVHFGLGQPSSGHRIFVPSSAPASAPDSWDGVYDRTFDVAHQ